MAFLNLITFIITKKKQNKKTTVKLNITGGEKTESGGEDVFTSICYSDCTSNSKMCGYTDYHTGFNLTSIQAFASAT